MSIGILTHKIIANGSVMIKRRQQIIPIIIAKVRRIIPSILMIVFTTKTKKKVCIVSRSTPNLGYVSVNLFHGVKKLANKLFIEKKLNKKYSKLFHSSNTEKRALP